MDNLDVRLWVLLGKKLNKEATTEEIEELTMLLSKEQPLMYDNDLLQKLWEVQLVKQNSADLDTKWGLMEQVIMEAEKDETLVVAFSDPLPAKKNNHKFFYLAAASVLLIFCIALGIKITTKTKNTSLAINNKDAFNEISSKLGSKSSIVLPEGTRVWLNAGSKINYSKNFTNDREVYLTGEAYFDVTHDAEHPFTIHAHNVNIKVLGTIFNVKAYPDDEFIETSLIKGSIELSTTNDPGRKILLRPNEKITILKTIEKKSVVAQKADTQMQHVPYQITAMVVSKSDSTIEDIGWMEEKLFFKAESFERLAKQMERWYAVNFIFEDSNTKKIKFTGAFDKQNIVEALQALQFSCNYNFSFSIIKNQITIKSK